MVIVAGTETNAVGGSGGNACLKSFQDPGRLPGGYALRIGRQNGEAETCSTARRLQLQSLALYYTLVGSAGAENIRADSSSSSVLTLPKDKLRVKPNTSNRSNDCPSMCCRHSRPDVR